MAEKRLLSIDEFCEEYSMKRTTTYREIKRGKLKTRVMEEGSNKTFIAREDAEAWAANLVAVK